MRSIHIIGIILFTAMIFVSSGYSQSKTIKPLYSGNKILITESGHTGIYYLISKDNPSYLLVKGPGKLQIVTRVILKPGENLSDYSFVYRIDGSGSLKKVYKSVAVSGKAIINKGISGKSGIPQQYDIELGPGEHTIEIEPGKEVNPAAAKYLFKKTKAQKFKWVLLSPSRPNEPVDLVAHEDVVHYYRFSQKRPLNVVINGPTTLRVLTRFENHYDMKGRIDYRVQVKEDNKVIHTYLLSSVYSEVTTYRKNNKLIPGKAREFYIQVPSGRHKYTIVPLDKDKKTILARVLFPKKDVKLKE